MEELGGGGMGVVYKAEDARLGSFVARKSYQDFLAEWKNADPDIPLLQQAKAEYAKMQSRSKRPVGGGRSRAS